MAMPTKHGTALLALSGWLAAVSPCLAETQPLVVEVSGIRSAEGKVRVSLYREPDSFRKEDRAFRLLTQPAIAGKATLVFADIPPGRYAVMAYHDENGDEKLNLRLGMFPTEGYALSNNPKVIGPPRFDDSAFDLPATPAPLPLILKY
jgi:uncharacterized protein (DUF2141 family)